VQEAEVKALIAQGSINLPTNCTGVDIGDVDPWLRWQCSMADVIKGRSNGTEALSFKAANAEIKKGDVHGQEIGFWTPTRQIKTFHPRSPGMVAYRDAIRGSIEQTGQL
jgi:hypothetical protein